jgi:trehalose synthase
LNQGDSEAAEVPVTGLALRRLAPVLGEAAADALLSDARDFCRVLDGRTIWNINSTSTSGGVAELLQSLVAYGRGAGCDERWVLVRGDEPFFRTTKDIHNRLHGTADGDADLDSSARQHYEEVLSHNAARFIAKISPDDLVIAHDPQTAGLIPLLKERGNIVLWRCHVGVDQPNEVVRSAWNFLRPYVLRADRLIFSSPSFIWEGLPVDRVVIIHPAIDPLAVKNVDLEAENVAGILRAAGVEAADGYGAGFIRQDGSLGRVTRRVASVPESPIEPGVPLVVQVSRWDRLKDPAGVLRAFSDHVAPRTSAHLVLAGPATSAGDDDPQGREVHADIVQAWQDLPEAVARRIHLLSVPVEDLEENAIIVNALQRRATVVAQKSLAEGFGLTVSEAMWKGRPVVASGLGGIGDQIEDGRSGVLVDPRDLRGFGAAVTALLHDGGRADAVGRAARERVREHFLIARHLQQQWAVLASLLPPRSPR